MCNTECRNQSNFVIIIHQESLSIRNYCCSGIIADQGSVLIRHRRSKMIGGRIQGHRQRINGCPFVKDLVRLRVSAVFHGVAVTAAIPEYVIENLSRIRKSLILHGIAVVCYILLCGGFVHICSGLEDSGHFLCHD